VVLAREGKLLGNLRKITLLAAGAASQRFMAGLQDQQEVMADISDCIMAVFALESALLRARKLAAARAKTAEMAAIVTQIFADEALGTVEQAAKRVLAASSEGDSLGIQLTVLRRFAKSVPVDGIDLARKLSKYCTEVGRYCF